MALDLEDRLRQSNARFVASINRILERYNRPFEDDLLISMKTLTYDTPDGAKQWGQVSTKKLKKWKKEVFKQCNRGSERNAEMSKQQTSDFEDGHSTVHQESPGNSRVDILDIDEESDADIVPVNRKLEDIHFQNLYVDDEKIQEKVEVQVDVIVQDNSRKIPKWIVVAPQGSSEGVHLASPVQELIGSQAAVCRKKVESSDECSWFRPQQSQFSGVPLSPNIITIPRHQLSPELNQTCCNSILEEYQSADEECSWSNATLADLYPAMVEILKRVITKQSRRKELKSLFGNLRYKRWRSGRPKLIVTVGKIRGFRHPKLKRTLLSICSSRSEDMRNQTFGNNRVLGDDKCSINDLSGLVPYSSEYRFITPPTSSGSTELHLVKESKTQKIDFPCDASEFRSSAWSYHGNSNTFIPDINYSHARASNTLVINPEKIISESLIPFQGKCSLPSLSVKQSLSQMPQKYKDGFEILYYKPHSKEIEMPLTLTRPLSNSQNPEDKERSVKCNLSDSVRSDRKYDKEFDRIYEQLFSDTIPKLAGFKRASNLRKCEGIQMSETVNAFVNSPGRTLSAFPRVKRLRNLQNDHLCSSPKRLKAIPEGYSPSTKCQQVSHSKNVNLQTVHMDLLTAYNGSNHSLFDSENCQYQDSGFHASSD